MRATNRDNNLAVRELDLGNAWLTFKARFSGSEYDVTVPIEAVLAIYRDMIAHGQHSACFYPPQRTLQKLLPLGRAALRIHSRRDTLDHLNEEGLQNALRVVREIARDVVAAAPR